MKAGSTYYLSKIIGSKISFADGRIIGKVCDIAVDTSLIRPKVVAVIIDNGGLRKVFGCSNLDITKGKRSYSIICKDAYEIAAIPENAILIAEFVYNKQIVDLDGRKLVKANDLRLAVISAGAYIVAVDVGVESVLRKMGLAWTVKKVLKPLGISLPGKLILWDDVETIDYTNKGIKLSKTKSRLATLHPSDLADIIEDLDTNMQVAVFASLDEEKAADVLEELETEAQINVLESLSVEKAADVLEKMPADEVADILDVMEEEKAEELLCEMEVDASEEVRELMEYPDNTVGSLMTTEYISFYQGNTVDDVLAELRRLKPDPDNIYYLYVLDDHGVLVAIVSLRDIVISEPDTKLKQIMNSDVIYVHDMDKLDCLADIISKYSLLAIPVVNEDKKMLGMVVIDDVVYDLLKRKRRKI